MPKFSKKMDWRYVSGFFDGEGNVNNSAQKIGLTFSNTNETALRAIHTFMGCGKVRISTKLHGAETHPCHRLDVQAHKDVLKVAKNLLRFSIIKREQLNQIIERIESKEWRAENGAWAKVLSANLLRKLYWDESMSSVDIAKRYGTWDRTILNLMEQYGIRRRNLSESIRLHWSRRRL